MPRYLARVRLESQQHVFGVPRHDSTRRLAGFAAPLGSVDNEPTILQDLRSRSTMHNLQTELCHGGAESFGRLSRRAVWVPPIDGLAQEGGDPVKVEKHGLLEVAAP